MRVPLVGNLLDKKGRYAITITPGETLLDASRRMTSEGVGCLLVIREGKLTGVLTWHDMLRFLAEHPGAKLHETPVTEIMSVGVRTTTEAARLDEAEGLMVERGIRHLPVTEDGRIVGLVSRIDLLVHHLQEASAMTNDLERYVMGAYPG